MTLSNGFVKPQRLTPQTHSRVWGSIHLEPWFPNPAEKVGEVWFHDPESPVLVKFLFATENLSVQVHPDDALAQQCGHMRGKTEMWHILHTEPNAQIALGFRETLTPDHVRRAAGDGSIMDLLRWISVHPGETWFIPAGAVHAIGAGITLCEIQQNSDVTYRLFDYGRGREMHIDESIRALDLNYQAEPSTATYGVLIDCPYFQVSRLDVETEASSKPAELAIAVEGSGTLNGEPFRQGEAWSTAHSGPLDLTGNARLLTVTTKT